MAVTDQEKDDLLEEELDAAVAASEPTELAEQEDAGIAAIENDSDDEYEFETTDDDVEDDADADDGDDAEEEPADKEVPAAEEEPEVDLDDELYDKVNHAARLLRARKAALAREAEEDAAKLNDLRRAVKLLELKPQMEQAEMSDLLGMRLRELDALLAMGEEAGVVVRVQPEEEDMRIVLVSAADDAEEKLEVLGKRRKKLVAQLSRTDAQDIVDLMDRIIDPLVKMGLDNEDRGPRGGHDDRGGHGGRGGYGDRGGRNDRGGNRGSYGDRGGRNDRGGNRGSYGDRGSKGGSYGDRSNRGGYGDRNNRGSSYGDRSNNRNSYGDRNNNRGGNRGGSYGGRSNNRGSYGDRNSSSSYRD